MPISSNSRYTPALCSTYGICLHMYGVHRENKAMMETHVLVPATGSQSLKVILFEAVTHRYQSEDHIPFME